MQRHPGASTEIKVLEGTQVAKCRNVLDRVEPTEFKGVGAGRLPSAETSVILSQEENWMLRSENRTFGQNELFQFVVGCAQVAVANTLSSATTKNTPTAGRGREVPGIRIFHFQQRRCSPDANGIMARYLDSLVSGRSDVQLVILVKPFILRFLAIIQFKKMFF